MDEVRFKDGHWYCGACRGKITLGECKCRETCEWYALCTNDVIGTTPHPVLGDVPICQRCADKHDLTITPFEDEESDDWEDEWQAAKDDKLP